MRGLSIIAAAVIAAVLGGRGVEAAPRVISLNLCADQLLLALAEPEQIVSLSPFARDPRLSYMAERAKAFPLNRGTGEEVLVARPDLVLIGRFGRPATRELLRRFRVPTEVLEPWRGVEDGIAQVRRIAAAIGRPERGERLIADIRAAEARARGAAATGGTVALLQRRGWVGGPDGTHEPDRRDGRPRQRRLRLGLQRSGFLDLETILTRRPDLLLMANADPAAIDQGTALLGHPALARLYPRERRMALPERLTACGGPSTPEAFDHMAAEVRGRAR